MHDVVATSPTDHRSDQQRRIIAAAVVCFARSGFHGTSMQQICAEAGMSPGALYRYFPSKESLIGAIVEGERAERARLFHQLAEAPSLLDGLTSSMSAVLTEDTMMCARLGPEIMAEAIRNERLRAALEPVEAESRDMLRAALTTAREQGQIDAGIDIEDLMILLQAVGDGLVLNNQLHPEWNIIDRLPALSALVGRMLPPAPAAQEDAT